VVKHANSPPILALKVRSVCVYVCVRVRVVPVFVCSCGQTFYPSAGLEIKVFFSVSVCFMF